MKKKTISVALAGLMICGMLTACGTSNDASGNTTASGTVAATETAANAPTTEEVSANAPTTEEVSADAETLTVSDGQTLSIEAAGDYVITGTAKDATVFVDAGDEDEVNIVLDGVSVTNDSTPCIYVKNAACVNVLTSEKESSLSVTGTFTESEDMKADAVIYSKDDLVIAGKGTLTVDSTDSGIKSNDDLTVESGTITINATNDAIHANGKVTITGGNLTLTAAECIEATVIQVDDGTISITASDDGINAAEKSSDLTPSFTMNGGNIVITMGAGDTDGVDSNGDITINGGTIDITGQSTFDYDGTATYNGGTIIENGETTNTITNQFGGGAPGGNFGGNFDGNFDGQQLPEGFEKPDGKDFPEGMTPPNWQKDSQ